MCLYVCVFIFSFSFFWFSHGVNKKKNPDKALIIREEQGYVDKEVFDFEFVFIEIKGFWKCWAWSIHVRFRDFLNKIKAWHNAFNASLVCCGTTALQFKTTSQGHHLRLNE